MTRNSMIIIAILVAVSSYSMAGIIPSAPLAAAPFVAAPAPIVTAPAAIGYTHAVPQNIPPFASRVDINTRSLASPFITAPYVSAPYVGSPYPVAPAAAVVAAPPSQAFVAAPGAYGPVVLG